MMNLKCNVCKTEKIIRIIVGLVMIYIAITFNPWFYVVAAIVLTSAMLGCCLVTKLLGIDTCKKSEQSEKFKDTEENTINNKGSKNE